MAIMSENIGTETLSALSLTCGSGPGEGAEVNLTKGLWDSAHAGGFHLIAVLKAVVEGGFNSFN